MERYYKILGLSNNATKEEIKKAYHKKIKAIHPDKLQGTHLEDTATFLSTEINEAYNVLIKQFHDEGSSRVNEKQAYFEKDIYFENLGLLKYSLSNDIGLIQDAVFKRTGNRDTSFINIHGWRLNTRLSENVKKVMNENNVNYSMTYYTEEGYKKLVINKRDGEKWYITGYVQEPQTQWKRKGEKRSASGIKTAGRPSYRAAVIVIIICGLIALSNLQGTSSPSQSHQRTTRQPTITTTGPRQVANSHQAIASARPGDYIIRTNGQRVVLNRSDIDYAARRLAGTQQRAPQRITTEQQIRDTLAIVARHKKARVDVNGDGLVNCIDAAVLFYQYFPDRNRVRIMRNINNAQNFNHLFNAVNFNGQWRTIEPQAFYANKQVFWMRDIWGRQYNPNFNRNETERWRVYARR